METCIIQALLAPHLAALAPLHLHHHLHLPLQVPHQAAPHHQVLLQAVLLQVAPHQAAHHLALLVRHKQLL